MLAAKRVGKAAMPAGRGTWQPNLDWCSQKATPTLGPSLLPLHLRRLFLLDDGEHLRGRHSAGPADAEQRFDIGRLVPVLQLADVGPPDSRLEREFFLGEAGSLTGFSE